MRNLKIAPRYAKALFDLAQERNNLDKISEDLKGITAIIFQSPELINFLRNPTIPAEKHKNVIKELFSLRVEDLTLTFLFFLAERKKIGQLDLIGAAFKRYYSKLCGILPVTLTSAYPLSREQVQKITEKLDVTFKKKIEPTVAVSKDLLGGFKLQVKDKIYDFSIQSQLDKFRQSVLTV